MSTPSTTGAEPDRAIEYRGRTYAPEAFERAFNPRVYTPDAEEKAASRAGLSEAMRARYYGIYDIAYGHSPREVLDVFPAGSEPAPVMVYIHGGFWRTGSTLESSFFAEPFLAGGICCAMVTYDLCPAVTLGEIVKQIPRAVAWVRDNIAEHGGDPERIHLVGHSAGAHLISMALATPGALPADGIVGATLISGIYDLTPLPHISVNADLRLTADDIAPLSPLRHPPRRQLPLVVAVGANESPEWIEQSSLYAEVADEAGCPVTWIELPEADHYSVVIDIDQPGNALAAAIVAATSIRA